MFTIDQTSLTLLFGGSFDPPHLGHKQVVKSVLDKGLADQVWLVPVANHPFDKKIKASFAQRVEMLGRIFDLGERGVSQEQRAKSKGESEHHAELPTTIHQLSTRKDSLQSKRQSAPQTLTHTRYPIPNSQFSIQNYSQPNHEESQNQLISLTNQVFLSTIESQPDHPGYSYHTLLTLQQQFPDRHFGWLMGSDLLANFHRWEYYQQLMTEFPVFVYPRAGYDFQPWFEQMTALKDMPEIEMSSQLVRQRIQRGHEVSSLVGKAVVKYIEKCQLYVA